MPLRIFFFAALAVAALIAAGNVAILVAYLRARRAGAGAAPGFSGPHNLHVVDARLWRGSAPDHQAYEAMAGAGVGDVVDLRAEGKTRPPPGLELTHHHIPVRDGQPPTPVQVRQFLAIMDRSESPVYLHCAAGVGRTGSMTAAYEVMRRGATPAQAVSSMLAVGPPSLEQISFVRQLEADRVRSAGRTATVVSRVLDAPRRSWSRIRHAVRG